MISSLVIRDAFPGDVAPCVAVWVAACAARDGEERAGIAERAEKKFSNAAARLVAERDQRVVGFTLATAPGSGSASDPADAAVLGLLAVSPDAQCDGLGGQLLRGMATRLARLGYATAVLHVLADNTAALRLYESEGWHRHGEPFDHALLHRPSQSYVLHV